MGKKDKHGSKAQRIVRYEISRGAEGHGRKRKGIQSEHKIKSKDQISLDIEIKLSNCVLFFPSCRG